MCVTKDKYVAHAIPSVPVVMACVCLGIMVKQSLCTLRMDACDFGRQGSFKRTKCTRIHSTHTS